MKMLDSHVLKSTKIEDVKASKQIEDANWEHIKSARQIESKISICGPSDPLYQIVG